MYKPALSTNAHALIVTAVRTTRTNVHCNTNHSHIHWLWTISYYSPSSNAYWQSWQFSWPLHLNCVPEENAPGGNGSVTLVQVLMYIQACMICHSINQYNLPCKELCRLKISCRKIITRIRYYSMCNRHPCTVSRIWNVLNFYPACARAI